ncbi:ryanodine receptor 1-like [Pluvialis apricaria]
MVEGGGEFGSTAQQAWVSHANLVIGCLVDLATSLMTFTANGKEINTFFQVEPNTKLFPAVFTLPTIQTVIQFELGKLKNIMPISAAMFSSERKNPEPQCPPWLVIQHLTPITWSRMPNKFLAVESTRLSERHSWMVECNELLIVLALHIHKENRSGTPSLGDLGVMSPGIPCPGDLGVVSPWVPSPGDPGIPSLRDLGIMSPWVPCLGD